MNTRKIGITVFGERTYCDIYAIVGFSSFNAGIYLGKTSFYIALGHISFCIDFFRKEDAEGDDTSDVQTND